MKNLIWGLLVLISTIGSATVSVIHAQEKYIDKNGIVVFEASEKLFEEVKATNKSVTAIFDKQTHQIAALALMKGFHFKNSLMEEHFNENYIESETYPKATFKGKITGLNKVSLSERVTEVSVNGILELHGKGKEIQTVLKVQQIGDIISMTGEFMVTPGDFNITIPKIVRNKIAKVVHVKINFKLAKK